MTPEQRIRDVLAKLSTLSEAPASSMQPRTSQSASQSSVPIGVRLRAVDPDAPPSKDHASLFDYYAWHFARIDPETEPARATKLVLKAEHDYLAQRFPDEHRKALRSGALVGDNAEGKIAEEVAMRRVVADYQGTPAIEVAIFEETTEVWVRKARQLMKCDPDTGYPKAPFLDWSEAERAAEVAKLRQRFPDYGQKRIADHFGVAKSTVQPYWEPRRAAA